jgi:hypothetical protein
VGYRGVLQKNFLTDISIAHTRYSPPLFITRRQRSREATLSWRYWRRLLPPGAMAESDDREAQPLPDELASALRRTTNQTLAALQSLRIALRDHVQSERARGATLDEIDTELKEMIDAAGNSDGDGHSPERIAELRKHVLGLSEAFYSPRRGLKKS